MTTYSLVFVFVAVGIFSDRVSAPTEQYGYPTKKACMEAGVELEETNNFGFWTSVRYLCVPNPVYSEE